MGELFNHARRELDRIETDEKWKRGILKIVSIFGKMGHSGGSAPIAIDQITKLLSYQNLSPLTDDPEEWHFHGPEMAPPEGVWQNKRNPEAFSKDAGLTYVMITEAGSWDNENEAEVYESEKSGKYVEPVEDPPGSEEARVEGELALVEDKTDWVGSDVSTFEQAEHEVPQDVANSVD